MENQIQEIIEDLLNRLSTPFRKIKIEQKDENTFRVNIESEEPSLLIGHHGENIFALQNVLKNIFWKNISPDCKVIIDVDNYRQRQEENVIKMAERKVDLVRQTGAAQSLPAMSPYFRRVIHLYLAEKFTDIVSESSGEGDFRHIILKAKAA